MIAPPSFSNVLDASRHEEQRRALRSLLMSPILFSGSAPADKAPSGNGSRRAKYVEESFVLVRRHQAYLTHWFARYTGWTLILRSGSARLVKRTVDTDDPTRGARDPGSSGAALSRRRYVLWCLSLALLHEEGRQTTLQRLADQVVRLADSIPELAAAGCNYDLKTASTRRELVCVIRLLLGYGLIRRVDGNESKFAETVSVDCLYDINTGLLTDVLYMPRSLSSETGDRSNECARPPRDRSDGQQQLSAFYPEREDDSLRPRELEHRLIGQLLDNPVLYFDDLTQREYQYWQSQRSRLLQVIEEATGLVAEVRREGVALLDPQGELTDARMPDSGTVGHATLLMAEFLADRCHDQTSPPVPIETLRVRLGELALEHKTHWRKNVCDPTQTALLLEEVLERLEMLRMIRWFDQAVLPLPAVHRFAADHEK